MSQLKINGSEPDQEYKLSGYQQNEIEKDHKKEIQFLRGTIPYDMTTWQSFLISHQYLRYLDCRRYCCAWNDGKKKCCPKFDRRTNLEKVFEKGQGRIEEGLDVRNLIKTQEMLRSMLYVMEPGDEFEESRKLMRIQRRQRVLEPASSDFDSEVDDLKDFKKIYEDEIDKVEDLDIDAEDFETKFAEFRNDQNK